MSAREHGGAGRAGGSGAPAAVHAPATPLAAVLGRLPAYPGALLFVAALNLALPPHLPADVRASLLRKRLRIRVTDAGVAFDFTWRGERFGALRATATPDLEIAASAQDFLALARRQEDPDTLFFSRRLAMEGDTELGLMVKNTIDAIDVPLSVLARQALQRLLPFPLPTT
jgi:predicted lipid carrier protein YhbT